MSSVFSPLDCLAKRLLQRPNFLSIKLCSHFSNSQCVYTTTYMHFHLPPSLQKNLLLSTVQLCYYYYYTTLGLTHQTPHIEMKKRIVCEKKETTIFCTTITTATHTDFPQKKGKKEHHIRYLYRKSELVSPPISQKNGKKMFF